MKPALADTSFYLALLNPRDAVHAKAVEVSRSLRRRVVVTEFVLIETGNALAATPLGRQRFLTLNERLRSSKTVTVIEASSTLLAQGLELYAERQDKQWSLTDCISFVVMRQQGLSDALTADHHFEQAGFTVHLK